MSSSFVKDCSDASNSSTGMPGQSSSSAQSNNKTVFIIVNNDAQIDQEQLSSLLGMYCALLFLLQQNIHSDKPEITYCFQCMIGEISLHFIGISLNIVIC